MMNKKGSISLILAASLLTGMLSMFNACGSGEDAQTSNTDKASKREELNQKNEENNIKEPGGTTLPDSDTEETPEYDGTWLVVSGIGGDAGETAFVISGNTVKFYIDTSDEGFAEFTDDVEQISFDRSSGALTYAETEDEFARYTMYVRDDCAILWETRTLEVVGLVRIDTPIEEFHTLDLENGYWYTDDYTYELEIKWRSLDAVYNVPGYDYKYTISIIRDAKVIPCSNGYLILSDDTGAVVLNYTLDGDRLTISNFDRLFGQGSDHPSEITFIYHGKNPIE